MVEARPKATVPRTRTLSPTLMACAEDATVPLRYVVLGVNSTVADRPLGACNAKLLSDTPVITP
jgi:hypothetical protein